MRTPLIAGNWKMHKTVEDTVLHMRTLKPRVRVLTSVDIVVAPPFPAVHAAAEVARGSNVAVAAQNLYWEATGAYTGEVSAPMIREAGAEYVIIGHSERRTLFGETDETVNRKLVAALAAGLVPIVCVGETLAEREHDRTLAVLDRQLADGLAGRAADQIAGLVMAYEPVWAIGTGRTATAGQAQAAHLHIRRRLAERAGAEAAEACRILYGGSVKPGNTAELLAEADVDGALVGGASLDVDDFVAIVTAAAGRV
jgi:triosephosphate isomerase